MKIFISLKPSIATCCFPVGLGDHGRQYPQGGQEQPFWLFLGLPGGGAVIQQGRMSLPTGRPHAQRTGPTLFEYGVLHKASRNLGKY